MNRKIIPNIPEIDYYGNEVDYVFNLLEAAFAGTGDKTDKSEIAACRKRVCRMLWLANTKSRCERFRNCKKISRGK